MKKEDIKTISELLRDAFGVFRKDMQGEFGDFKKEVKTDISGLTALMVENFTETQERIEKMRSATEGFVKLHDVLDGRVVELEKRLAIVERELQIARE